MKQIIVLTIISIGFVNAQISTSTILKVNGGVSVPQSPEQFYDYWSNGVSLSITALYPSRTEYTKYVSFGVSHFVFDDERFFKRINMVGTTTTITGGNTTIAQLSGGIHYNLQPYEQYNPFVFAGGSASFFHMSHATVRYPYQTREQESRYKFYTALQFGGGVSYPVSESFDALVSLQRNFGLKRDKTVNTDFTTFEAGILWILL